ncbi:MAG: hypothetical protein ACI4KG_02105 [Oscillospiraceae bacterium]
MEKLPMYIEIYSFWHEICKRGSYTETVNKVVSRDVVIRSIDKTKATLDVVKAIADALDKLGYPVSIEYSYNDKDIHKGIIKRKMYYDGN